MAISPSSGAQQIFESVFKRKAESPEEVSFLRGAEERKSGGALQGALEHRQQQGGFSEEQIPQAEGALDLLQKKMKQADDAQKKIFSENLKLELKKTLLSSSAFKELQGQQTKLAGEVQERKTLPDVKPGITDPTQAGQISLAQKGDLARLLSNVGQSIKSQESGVGSILDRIQASQEREADFAESGFERALDFAGESRAFAEEARKEELFPLEKQKLQAEIVKALRPPAGAGGVNVSGVIPGDPNTLSGQAQAVLENPALFSEAGFLTPTAKGKVIQELMAFGINADQITNLTLPTFSAKAKADLSNFDAIGNKLDAALGGLQSGTFKTGFFESRRNEALALSPVGAPPGWDEYAGLLAVTSAEQLKILTGVQFSVKEYDRLQSFLPNRNDQETKALNKMNNMKRVIGEIKAERTANELKNAIQFKQETETTAIPGVGDTFRGETVTNVREVP